MKNRIITDRVRLVRNNLRQPDAAKYYVELLVSKDDAATVSAIDAAVEAAAEKGEKKFGDMFPQRDQLLLPLRDGDTEKDDPVYKGYFFLRASTLYTPEIVDSQAQPVQDRTALYSGSEARVSLRFYPFAKEAAEGQETVCGIAAELGNIQLLEGGRRIYPRIRAAQEFSKLEQSA